MSDIVAAAPASAGNSLAERMRSRRETLERNATRTWDLPGYEGILAVKYRAIGYQALRKIVHRHAELDDEGLMELYVACDTLMTATDEVYEIDAKGSHTPLGERWMELARRADVSLPENPTQRQALLALVPDTAVMALYRRYERFVARTDREADEAVVRDFDETA
jgi:hypothetical protein